MRGVGGSPFLIFAELREGEKKEEEEDLERKARREKGQEE